MPFPKAKRRRITINGEPVVAVDYPASQANVLYRHVTGAFLHPENPYKVDGLHRDTVKHLMQMMLNNGSRKGASTAARENLSSLKKSAAEAFEFDSQKHRGIASMMNLLFLRAWSMPCLSAHTKCFPMNPSTLTLALGFSAVLCVDQKKAPEDCSNGAVAS